MIRILLADDHAMVRTGLRLVLERQGDMTVVGEAQDGAEAVEMAVRLLPAVVILDIGLPGVDGLDALERIKARAPQVRALMLTGIDNQEYVHRALRSGASGFLLKQGSSGALVRAVRAVARGELAFEGAGDGGLTEADLWCERTARRRPPHSTLTAREREVLRLVAQGYSNADIAERLGISVKTVDTHRMRVMDKIDLHSRANLTRYALQHGFLVAT
jgi:two-component system response regulator NreC